MLRWAYLCGKISLAKREDQAKATRGQPQYQCVCSMFYCLRWLVDDQIQATFIPLLNDFSKIYEKIIKVQLIPHLDRCLSKLIAAYIQQYNTQHVLIRMIENFTGKKVLQSIHAKFSFSMIL